MFSDYPAVLIADDSELFHGTSYSTGAHDSCRHSAGESLLVLVIRVGGSHRHG